MSTEDTLGVKLIVNAFIAIFSGLLAYLQISEEPFILFSLLIIIDYITGLMKAKTLMVSITSNKMKYGLISKLSLLFIPIILAIGAKAIEADFKFIFITCMNILIISEVYSIIGNIYSIRTKEELPEYDAVALLGKQIRNILIKDNK